MRCLCCGKEIDPKAPAVELQSEWHKRCIKKFFGTESIPRIELTEKAIQELANQTVNKGLTVPGVQKKMSLHLTSGKDSRLTLVNYPTGFILKPQTEEYSNLPEYEQMTMLMAEAVGIHVVPHGLIKVDDRFAYITKRIDRHIIRGKADLLAMEDFCQLAGRQTVDKYKGSYEICGKIIKKYSSYVGFDLSEFFLRIVFSFVIGNSILHLKNFSLIEEGPGSRIFKLSAAYDMLPVNVILPTDKEQTALTVHGKKRNIRRKDFMSLADSCGISEKASGNLIESVLRKKEKLDQICRQSQLLEIQQEQVLTLMEERIRVLGQHQEK